MTGSGPSRRHSGKPQLARARSFVGAALIFFGLLAAALGVWAGLSEHRLQLRAVEALARVNAHEPSPRSTYTRLGMQRDFRPVPRLEFAASNGSLVRAWLNPWDLEDMPIGETAAILYDPLSPGVIRLRGAIGANWFHLALAIGGLCAALAGARLLMRRPHALSKQSAPAATVDQSGIDHPEFGPLPPGRALALYSLAGCPVMELEPTSGGRAVLAMDRASGAMVGRNDLWDRLRDGSIDLDRLDMPAFRALLHERREAIATALQREPLVWRETEDLFVPFSGDWGVLRPCFA